MWEDSHTKRAVKYATALRLGTAETEAILKRFRKSGVIGVVFASITDLSSVCEYVDDSECLGAGALEEEADSEGFTGDYPFDI